jgi:hypothetical protein
MRASKPEVCPLLFILTALGGGGCSDPSTPHASTSLDGGSDGALYAIAPPLPKICDDSLAETVIDSPSLTISPPRLRIVGEELYFQTGDGIHRTTFPNGTDTLVIAALQVPSPTPDADMWSVGVWDFWVDTTSITAIVADAIYTAPREDGGVFALKAGTAPDWSSASVAIAFGSLYERSGDTVYRVVEDPPSRTGTPSQRGSTIRKLSLIDGVATDFLRLALPDANAVRIAGDDIHYIDIEEHERQRDAALLGSGLSLFRSPLAEPRPMKLAGPFFHGNIAAVDSAVYVSEDAVSVSEDGFAALGKLWRIAAGVSPVALRLPAGVAAYHGRDSRISAFNQGAIHDGALYWLTNASYRLPDDRRTARRYVVVRIRPDSDRVELVRCLPEPSNALVPRDHLYMEVNDIAASETGVYVSVRHVDRRALTTQTHIYRVAP